MKLQDQLYDAVADVSADLPSLAADARRRGLAIRRRRRALASVGAAAAVVAVVAGGFALRPATVATDSSDLSAYAADLAARPLSGATVPNSGRATAASLLAAVRQVAGGTPSRIDGGDPDLGSIPPSPESNAGFLWHPADGGGPGVVFVNVQPIDMVYRQVCPAGSKDCRTVPVTAWSCDASFMVDCKVSKTPGGDTLRTYRDLDSDSEVHRDGFVRQVAEVISPARRLRLVVSSSNNAGDGSRPRRSEPVLTLAQLEEVATQRWWGFRLPAEYAGDDLPSYLGADRPDVPSGEPSPAG
jgi:hypothetical protein